MNKSIIKSGKILYKLFISLIIIIYTFQPLSFATLNIIDDTEQENAQNISSSSVQSENNSNKTINNESENILETTQNIITETQKTNNTNEIPESENTITDEIQNTATDTKFPEQESNQINELNQQKNLNNDEELQNILQPQTNQIMLLSDTEDDLITEDPQLNLNVERTGIQYNFTAILTGVQNPEEYSISWKSSLNKSTPVITNLGNEFEQAVYMSKDATTTVTATVTNGDETLTAEYLIEKLTVTIVKNPTNTLQQTVHATFFAGTEELTDMEDCGYKFVWSTAANTKTVDGLKVYTYATDKLTSEVLLYNNNISLRSVSISIYESNAVTQIIPGFGSIVLDSVDAYVSIEKDEKNRTLKAVLKGPGAYKYDNCKITYNWYYINSTGNIGSRINLNSKTDPNYNKTYNKQILEDYNDDVLYSVTFSITDLDANPLYNNGQTTYYAQIYTNPPETKHKNIIYVDYNLQYIPNGGTTSPNQRYRGYTPDTPVKSLAYAYQLLCETVGAKENSFDDNIIVLLSNYTENTTTYPLKMQNYLFNIPATVTSSYGSVNPEKDYSTLYYFSGKRYLHADTKFEYLTFVGKNGANGTLDTTENFLHCQGNNLTMGSGIHMAGYTTTLPKTWGEDGTAKITIVGGFTDYKLDTPYSQIADRKEKCTITIHSGCFGRIIGGSRNDSYFENTKNIFASENDPYDVEIIIDYEDEEANHRDGFTYDISTLVGGQADGSGYFNSTVNVHNGDIRLLVGGSQGMTIKAGQSTLDANNFFGNTTLNISGGTIHEFYAGSLGRASSNGQLTYRFIGNINVNMTGGTILSDFYSAGACATLGNETENVTVSTKISGGIIEGNVYGGAYGVSPLNRTDAGVDLNNGILVKEAGWIHGDINLEISGGLVKGNVYGGGKGSDKYAKNTERLRYLAQIFGDINLKISDDAVIQGAVYGAGEGFTAYPEIAKVTGSVNLEFTGNPEINGNIYGAGANSQVIGNTNIKIDGIDFSGDVFGGGDLGKVTGNAEITIDSGTLENVYTGGNKATVINSKLIINGGETQNAFAGGNEANLTSSIIEMTDGSVTSLYGGGNLADIQDSTITITGGNIDSLFGGGFKGKVTQNTSIEISDAIITDLYGGGNEGIIVGNTDITVNSGNITNIYGGGNAANANNSQVTINCGDITNIYGGGNAANVNNSKVTINSGYITSVYGGGKSADVVNSEVIVNSGNIDSLYGGGYSGNVTNSTQVSIKDSTIENVYGGGYSGTVGTQSGTIDPNSVATKVTITSGTITDVFCGGNLGEIYGNTQVTVGTNNTTTTINGIVYGGGRGESSDSITVSGDSNVLIQGMSTNVSSYGSVKLGKVDGDVIVNFKNFRMVNPTSRYKVMNGIDRATTVSFDNSFVLLTNESTIIENGVEKVVLEGIKDIENIILPENSGLKISANGEISGDFIGGGELYLDSQVCLTVDGNISGSTTLTLNPEIAELGQTIFGTFEKPYMKVGKNSEATNVETLATSLVSGNASKYDILTIKPSADDWSYYYISQDVIITDYVAVNYMNIYGSVYNTQISENSDVNIQKSDSFTDIANVEYSFLDDLDKGDKYHNLGFNLQVVDKDDIPQILPVGTQITMVKNGNYYGYYVVENTNSINLGNFKNLLNNENYINNFDITSIPLEYVKINQSNGHRSYLITEDYRFVIDFGNCDSFLAEAGYRVKLDATDNSESIGKELIEDNINVVKIVSRKYDYTINECKDYYRNDENMELSINLNIGSGDIHWIDKYLKAKISFANKETGDIIALPENTKIAINGISYDITDGIGDIKILEDKLTSSVLSNEPLNIRIDMSEVLPQNRIPQGEYDLYFDLMLCENEIPDKLSQGELRIPVFINEFKDDDGFKIYGIKLDIDDCNDLQYDKIQLITRGLREKRKIKVIYDDRLVGGIVKIKSMKKIDNFNYEDFGNGKESILFDNTLVFDDTLLFDDLLLNSNKYKNVNITFDNNVSEGIYRIVFELFDKYGYKLDEDCVNFIVE